jgi:molybdate transport system substrate-binding protein
VSPNHSRPLRIRHPGWLVLCGVLLLGGAAYWLSRGPATLVVHCAASLRPAAEEIARAYEQETGQTIELRFGGSQDLLSKIEITRQGDVFLPADEVYIDMARDKGLTGEVIPLARQRGVVLIRAGYPGTIASWDDLVAEGVKLAQANPDAAAIGKLTRDRLAPLGKWEPLAKRTVVFTGTVSEAANAVKLGTANTVDAAVVWDTVAFQYHDLKSVRLPELDAVTARVRVAVLTTSTRPDDALRFARFLADRDKGLPVLRKHGFDTEAGAP